MGATSEQEQPVKTLRMIGETATITLLLVVGAVSGAALLYVLKVPNYLSFIVGAMAGVLAYAVMRGDKS